MKSKNALRLAVLCAVVSACSVPVMAAPATNPPGQGLGVAIGAGSNAQRDGVVAIGKNAHTNYAGGSGYANVNGDVAIGENATTHSYYDQSGSVAIGKNSYVENTIGQQDKLFAFNQTSFNILALVAFLYSQIRLLQVLRSVIMPMLGLVVPWSVPITIVAKLAMLQSILIPIIPSVKLD